jgi:hypothetical protein
MCWGQRAEKDTCRLCIECLEWGVTRTLRTSREVRNRRAEERIQGVAHSPVERRILEEELHIRSNEENGGGRARKRE